MANVKSFVRRIFRSGSDKNELAHQRLRRAVAHAKPRQVAELLEQGASPVWRNEREPQSLNALLLACERGDAHMLNLLLDWFFHERALLSLWGPQMYCMVIRHGHWQAFLRLHQRNVPQTYAEDQSRSLAMVAPKLPAPVFVAAESGQHQILAFLLRQQPLAWSDYEFGGHSLLSIASKHGHYECVEVVLASMIPTPDAMDFAVDCARRNRQAHVLVLLTSCLPEYNAPLDDAFKPPASQSLPASGAFLYQSNKSVRSTGSSLEDFAMLRAASRAGHHRGSLAETDVLSDGDDDDDERRRSSAWLCRPSDPVLGDAMPFSGNSDEAAYERGDPNRQTMDGFAILEAARRADARAKRQASDNDDDLQNHTSSGEVTWSSSSSLPLSSAFDDAEEDDDERWYAMKPDDVPAPIKSNESASSSTSTDPFTDFDGTFHDEPAAAADGKAADKYEEDAPEYDALPPAPVSAPLPQHYVVLPYVVPPVPAPPASHKVISIRSSNFRSYRTLPSITEERQTMVEHE